MMNASRFQAMGAGPLAFDWMEQPRSGSEAPARTHTVRQQPSDVFKVKAVEDSKGRPPV